MNAPTSTTPAPPTTTTFDIGPLLGTQPLASTKRQLVTLSGALLLFLFAWFLFRDVNGTKRFFVPFVPLILAIFFAYRFWSRFNVHADFGLHGLRLRRGSTTRRTIPYTDITHFQYHAALFRFDASTPATIRFRVVARDGFRFSIISPRIAPTFRGMLPHLAHLDYAREIIAGVMSNSLHTQYTQTQRVDWTADLRFENTDLVHKPFLGKERRIPISSATVLLIDDNGAVVTNPQHPQRAPFCSIQRKHPRLWSGMALFVRLQTEFAQATQKNAAQDNTTPAP